LTKYAVVLASLLLGCGGQTSIGGTGVPCEVGSQVQGVTVGYLDSEESLFHGAVTILGDDWLIGGLIGPAPSEPEEAEMTILRSGDVRIEPPPTPSEAVATNQPTPVVLHESGWGLLWLAAAAPDDVVGGWNPHLNTQMWFSQRSDGDWSAPLLLVSGLEVRWRSRGGLSYRPGRGPILVVMVRPGFQEPWEVRYGPPDHELRRLPLPPDVRPLDAAVVTEHDGSITALLTIEGDGSREETHAVIALTSRDGGESWVDRGRSPPFPGRPDRRLKAHVTPDGNVHALWSTHFSSTLHHVYLNGATDSWVVGAPPPAEGLLLGWVSGVDSCGILRSYWEVMLRSGRQQVEERRYSARWESQSAPFGDVPVFYLFEGQTTDGRWLVGWHVGEMEIVAEDVPRRVLVRVRAP
jgi:hypothetical protein